jgi:penicillin V acylase-like amidase (Ntn superfamily)
MCTRLVYVGQEGLVVTGRSMDWMTATGANLWALPAGLTRDGAAASNSFSWTSRYGSVISTMYDGVTVDGVNDAGLGANALYLSAAKYPVRNPSLSGLSVAAWTQYALDMFASVTEAVDALSHPPFQIVSPVLPGGHAATGHLALSDASGDSAIFEYIDGQLQVHHGAQYTVMTNDPIYEQQLALCAYWDEVGGAAMLPGTERPADRFVRARYYLNGSTFSGNAARGVAEVFGIIRNVSVPMIQSTPEKPNVAPTLWRSAIDHRSLTYFWEATNQPNVFWVELAKLDLAQGAVPKCLIAEAGPARSGEVSGDFVATELFVYIPEAVA